MPEGVEIEMYRRLAESVVGCSIIAVDSPDSWFLKRGTTSEELQQELPGSTITSADRIGKLLLLRLGDTGTLGLRFGMTGRLIVGASSAIEQLEYASGRDDPAWDRFTLTLSCPDSEEKETVLRINDPRRLGGVEWEPDLSGLGVDLFAFKPADVANRIAVGSQPVKARLLDQKRLAGVGNLIADETLWRARIHPARAAESLTAAEKRRLVKQLRSVASEFLANGGSHTGRLQPFRVRGGTCPKCRTELQRIEVGGRTTFLCPQHQPNVG